MVGPNNKKFFSALQLVSPLLEGEFNGQQFTVTHVVIAFSSEQVSRKKGTWVNSTLAATLAKNHSNTSTRGVNLYNESLVWVGSMKDGCCRKQIFKFSEGEVS